MDEIDDARSVVVRDTRLAILDARSGREVGAIALDRLFDGMAGDDPDYRGEVTMLHTGTAVAILASAISRTTSQPIYFRIAFVERDSKSSNVVALPMCTTSL